MALLFLASNCRARQLPTVCLKRESILCRWEKGRFQQRYRSIGLTLPLHRKKDDSLQLGVFRSSCCARGSVKHARQRRLCPSVVSTGREAEWNNCFHPLEFARERRGWLVIWRWFGDGGKFLWFLWLLRYVGPKKCWSTYVTWSAWLEAIYKCEIILFLLWILWRTWTCRRRLLRWYWWLWSSVGLKDLNNTNMKLVLQTCQ